MSPKSKTQARTWLTPAQVERMKDAAIDTGPTYLQDRNETIIAVLADTGLRVGELVALDWDDCHLSASDPYIYLPAEKQKGNAVGAASLDLGSDATRTLKRFRRSRYKDTDALIYSRQSDRATTQTVRNVVGAVAERANIRPHRATGGRGDASDVTPHTFRHSIAYRMIREEDARLEDVQLRLRHSARSTTERVYSHLRRR